MAQSRIQSDSNPFSASTPQPRPNNQKKVVSKNKGMALFKERAHFNLDYFEYPRNGTDPGKVLIFNHETYDDSGVSLRPGTRRDVNEIILSLQRTGFNIHGDDVMTDFTEKEVMDKLTSVLDDQCSLKNTNSLIVFFLTHGHEHDELHVFDTVIKCSDIWKKFNKCKALENKPKMFVFQACKGDYYSTIDATKESAPIIDLDPFTVEQLDKDMLILYSTLEGNASFRETNAGTWFIQELCRNITAYGRRDDMISIVTRTIKCVSNNYFLDDIVKQMPIFVSTLSKKFYLNRNKDRDLLLTVRKNQEEILQRLKEIAL